MPAPPITARALSPVAARPLSFSGVRVRVQDNNYRPLHWASYKDDNSECAQLLVDAGADARCLCVGRHDPATPHEPF